MALQRVLRTAQYITGAEHPAIQGLYIRWCEKKAQKIVRPQPPKPKTIFSAAGTGESSPTPTGS
jgi:hypothetical protein